MSENISWILQVAIHPGKLDDFRAVAKDLIAKTKSERGTLDYEWNLSEDETVCHILERYQDNKAVIAHVKSFGAFAQRFMEACHPTHFYLYGTPSAVVKEALADLQPIIFTPIGGFSR
jgi:quinol monooxygenase YgiN